MSSQLGPGRFRPTNHSLGLADAFSAPGGSTDKVKLATFVGINPNRICRLMVVDQYANDTGSIGAGWSLIIKARVRA